MVRGWTRAGVLAGGAVAVLLLTTAPASAHVEVSADKARAGATGSVLTFVAESESTTAGITALRVVLPAGIKPADVTWVSGPTGWALKAGADGYTVSGPAVPVGKDAEYAVRVRQLPTDTRQLVFKTLQTYSDGHVDRWIEEPNPGGAEPENPAPVLTVAAAPRRRRDVSLRHTYPERLRAGHRRITRRNPHPRRRRAGRGDAGRDVAARDRRGRRRSRRPLVGLAPPPGMTTASPAVEART